MNYSKLRRRKKQAIELHIEELVLHGFAPSDRHSVADALGQELTRLFSEQGLPSAALQAETFRTIDAGDITMGTGTKAKGVGAQVAGAVFGGLTGSLSSRNR